MSRDRSLAEFLPATGSSPVIPPLGERGSPTSGATRSPIFTTDGSYRPGRPQPAPPPGPPPGCPPPNLADVLEVRLPGISSQGAVGSREVVEESPTVESEQGRQAGRRVDGMTGRASQPSSLRTALPDSEEVESLASTNVDVLKGTVSASHGGEERNRAETRLTAEVELAARKAQQVAKVRTIAQEVARVTENDGNSGADDMERGEIERALAAVDETRRKRMEREQISRGGVQQDEEKARRRQTKREQLMKKRKEMEERLEEEACKMAELTESAKKKGESKFISEEAKRDAEERIRAEAEVVAQLERQAAEMALQRENIRKQLAEHEDERAAEIEASSSALKTKRALVEARMRQEEEEIKSLSETAKREVEAKMVEEAAAIAEMERQALQMSAKRVELQAEMSNRLRIDDTLAQKAQQISVKREAMEAKIQQEEDELQKLSNEAKGRVLEKMAAEAAAIAEMEREANELAAERAALASQIAYQRSSMVGEDGYLNRAESSVNGEERDDTQLNDARVMGTHFAGVGNVPDLKDPPGTCTAAGSADGEGAADEAIQSAPIAVSHHPSRSSGASGIVDPSSTPASSTAYLEDIPPDEGSDTGLVKFEEQVVEGSQWVDGNPPLAESIDLNVCAHCRTHERGMSSAHLAAAAGHLTCLEAIQERHSSLLLEVDPAGRSPLFYACANAHADAADLLIREGPQCCHALDSSGDTPLHAAALAGSRMCCQLLLQEGRGEVEPLNAMGMTPAHLAANNDVLEVLSQHGANLNAKDVDSRTPLFTACATDRLEKAEFLCELLECAGQDLGEADKRGDTPMHAAAYNGSTACLLLLLQYGVAPDVRNTKGLRPIDLAARRGHSACEKVLMEYQLHHHVNNSYFDSVLFLATLEGHKRCKEDLSGDRDNKKSATEALENSPLVRPESLWSLKRGRSVRLQHWGDWIAYEDQNAQSVFWYNHVAQKSQWDTPTGVGEDSPKLLSTSSMRLKRDGDWIEYTLPDGSTFYYNDKNNEFQWERPEQLSSRPSLEEWVEEGDPERNAAADATAGDWTAFKDPSTGLVFWYNHITEESRWEPPEELGTAVQEQRGARSHADGNASMPDEEVREVTSVDELFTPR